MSNKIIISNTKSLLQDFQDFCKKNNPANQEEAIKYFSIFGGLNIHINTSISIEKLIEKLILNKYKYLRNDINTLISGGELYSSILTGIALGDRRTNSAFKRANISFDEGIGIVDHLCKSKVLKLEKSLQSLSNNNNQYTVSEKLLFKSPFVRFWFACISPIFKGIRDGNYEEFFLVFQNRKEQFSQLIFEQLSHEIIKLKIRQNIFTKIQGQTIIKLGRYWDDDINIDLLVKTKNGQTIAGECKYTNSKINKAVLTNLKERCKKAKIDIDIFVLFSKSGFSSELKSLKGDYLKLFTIKSFKFN
ncbi:hypothetical protein MNB_ARC-1_100 [hydrothermal vent metagenome]|uniref:DUF234 domain-containing protein n=1 Tax=hydrothermal vent metagenome TaxID=652676 RepID=A0A3B1DTL0_9ZZZZ